MGFKGLSENEKLMVLRSILSGMLGVHYRNEEDIREIVLFFIGVVERLSGVKVSDIHLSENCTQDTSKFRNKTDEEKAVILELLKLGYNYSQIERMTGVSRRTVSRIRKEKL